jgi:hypothetical protein
LGSSNISGTARIEGTAWVENATVQNSVVIKGNASVWNGTYSGTAQVLDNAVLSNCTVSGNAIVKGDAMEWGVTFGNSVVVGGDAELGSCSTNGTYLQVPHPNNGRTECDGKTAADASNVDVNSTYTQFTDTQMAFTGSVACTTAALAVAHEEVVVNDMTVYPNPAVGSFNVSLPAGEGVLLSLYDSEGKEVLRKNVNAVSNVTIDTDGFKPGVFILKVKGKTKTFTKKVIITK